MTANLDEVLSLEGFGRGDPRMRAFPLLTLETLQADLLEIRLSPKLPDEVAHQLQLAKRLYVCGYFFYELFAVSIHHSVIAGDCALRWRFIESLPPPVLLVPPKKLRLTKEQQIEDPTSRMETIFDLLARGWRLRGQEEFGGSFGSLLRWAKSKGVVSDANRWDASLHLRHSFAHGSNAVLMPSSAFGILRAAAWAINPLFPDAETDAYDAKCREPANKARREFEQILRSATGTSGPDDTLELHEHKPS